MKPTIGVLITYYNEKDLLTECIQSLLQGNDIPDEILIYDDASEYPAEYYVPDNPLIQIIRGEINRGPSYGRNLLLNTSRCDYVHFHDADDLFHQEWCVSVRHTLTMTSFDMVVTGCSQVTEDGTTVIDNIFELSSLKSHEDVIVFFLRGNSNTLILTFLREVGLGSGGYYTHDLKAALDYYFNVRIASVSTNFISINKSLAIERLRAKSLTRGTTGKLSAKHRLETLRALNYLEQELPNLYHQHICDLAAQISSYLFHMGHYNEAQKGFDFALSVGKPTYRYQSRPYRLIAKNLGPMTAEKLSGIYHSIFPHTVRKILFQALNRQEL